jgi:hypothetical protein
MTTHSPLNVLMERQGELVRDHDVDLSGPGTALWVTEDVLNRWLEHPQFRQCYVALFGVAKKDRLPDGTCPPLDPVPRARNAHVAGHSPTRWQ